MVRTGPALAGTLSHWGQIVMAEGGRHNSSFRISPVDRLGRSISPLVLDAAEQIGRRAIRHAEHLLIDPAVAATLMEEAAAAVSLAIDRKKHGSAGGQIFWSKSARAHLQKGKTLIQVEADFAKIQAGNYNLEVLSLTGIRLIQPISIQPSLPNGGEQKP